LLALDADVLEWESEESDHSKMTDTDIDEDLEEEEKSDKSSLHDVN